MLNALSAIALMAALSPTIASNDIDACEGRIFNFPVFIDIDFHNATTAGDCDITLNYRMPPMSDGATIFSVSVVIENGKEVTTGVQITQTTLVCKDGKMVRKEGSTDAVSR
ncbi:hypothetical protein GW943_00390 [Candidatus Parcubacteria bacterium]|nr:hypothetical protein [Candidatus Parcubacteria bacterium]